MSEIPDSAAILSNPKADYPPLPAARPADIGCADVRFGILPPGSVCDEATGCPGMTTPGVSLLFALNGALSDTGRTRTVDPAAQSAAG
jgi:hypothetical protein